MAYKLKQRGYQNVTIIEKSPRIGGKAETFYYRQSEIPLSHSELFGSLPDIYS